MQIPSNLIMSSKKVRPSVWMSSWMLAWAAVSACTGAVKDYNQLVVVRVLLGICEAPFYPGGA
jgi:MFS family permease